MWFISGLMLLVLYYSCSENPFIQYINSYLYDLYVSVVIVSPLSTAAFINGYIKFYLKIKCFSITKIK